MAPPFFSLLSQKKEALFYFEISHSSCQALWKTQERQGDGQMHFALVRCICSRWTTVALRIVRAGHWGLVSQPPRATPSAYPPFPLQESKQAASGAITWHISIQFPLQNVFIFSLMACHFAGAFGQELILESKQIFRGAIFHQVLIFLHSQSLYSLI